MTIRSWLFVPGDSEKKLLKTTETGADAIIVDLEDSVTPYNKETARRMGRDWLEAHRRKVTERTMGRWVRINPLDTDLWREDLLAVMPAAPDGIVLPKAAGPEQVRQLAAELYEQESRNGLPTGRTQILPLVSETAHSALTITSYLDTTVPRLCGLTWGAEDLSAVLGATRKRDAARQWTDTFRFVRAQVLLTAHARGMMAVDTLYDDFRDEEGFAAYAAASKADGFTGMLAIHPSQVPVINRAFSASEEEIAFARAVVSAFASNPSAGALQIAGKMIDQPHLKLAKRMLGMD